MVKFTNFKSYVLNLQFLIIFAVIFFIPFVIDRNLVLIYEIPKVIGFKILIDFLILTQVIYNFGSSKLRVNSKMAIILLIFVVSNLISLFYSLNLATAIWGSFYKFFGLFTLAHLVIFVHLTASIVKQGYQEFVGWLLRLIPVVVTIHFLICIGQLLGGTLDLSLTDGRVMSTFGQPNFLAQYVLLLLPFQFYSWLTNSNLKSRLFNSLTIVFSICIIIWSGSRLAFILFGIQFLILLIILIKQGNLIRSINYGLLSLLLVAVILISSGITIERFSEFGLIDQFRLSIWQMSIEKINENPLFGWGYDQQQMLFASIQSNYGIGPEIIIDRSHNEYLDILLNGGVSALVLLFTINIFVLIKFIKSNVGSDFKVALLISYFTFLIYSFFDVNGIGGYSIYFFLFGLMICELKEDIELKEKKYLVRLMLLVIVGASIAMLALNVYQYSQMLL